MGCGRAQHSQVLLNSMKSKTLFALIDCNSFYCSCERLFRPDLTTKPVIVLSNNDGCAVSRSDEAKELGIKMGAPYFKIKDFCKQNSVHVFSSNYTLYGDMSDRVMKTLAELMPHLEIYSIDEAFAILPNYSAETLTAELLRIKETVFQYTGIPVSIGVGPTKVLAKAANHISKQNKKITGGVFAFIDEYETEQELKNFPVGEVWGIGRKLAQRLDQYEIKTADDLRQANDKFLQKLLTIVGFNIAKELRGESCITLHDTSKPRKQIISSRSFGKAVLELHELQESIATHVTSASIKLRQQGLLTRSVRVMIQTSRFAGSDNYFYSQSTSIPIGSANTSKLIACCLSLLEALYRPGLRYKKAGVIFNDLIPVSHRQIDLFETEDTVRSELLMRTIDTVNGRYGRGTLNFAACGVNKFWEMSRKMKSPSYTTRWSELLRVL